MHYAVNITMLHILLYLYIYLFVCLFKIKGSVLSHPHIFLSKLNENTSLLSELTQILVKISTVETLKLMFKFLCTNDLVTVFM